MSTDYINTAEDTDMAECEGEKVVTMMDVLQEQEEFEEDANAVLGASDDKNCTYSKGYIKRQAIYACLTCCSDAKNDPRKRAGVCLACSLNCHENHELIELYTRRNFRCDCGNPKFNSHPCQFTPNKTDLNEDNKYNQNFIGIYCTCHRPYPDPEAVTEDEMIQCTICEDWLHASHLEATLPSNDQYSEMICKACMKLNDFLHDYSSLAVYVDTEDVDVTETVTMESTEDEKKESLPNGSFELSPSKQEIDKAKNINMGNYFNNKMETMQYQINSSTTDNIKKEPTGLIHENIIVPNDDNKKEQVIKKETISISEAIVQEIGNATVTEKTNEVENILNTNETVTLNNKLTASEKLNISMELEEGQEFQNKNVNNIQNESVCAPNKSDTDVANVEVNNSIKNPEISFNENETILKDETTNNSVVEHVENLNSKSTNEALPKIEENEKLIMPKTGQENTIQSSDISSKIDSAPIHLEGNETEDQSLIKKDEEPYRNNSFQNSIVDNEIDTALKNLGSKQLEVRIETETNLLQSTEVSNEENMVFNNLDNSELEAETKKQTSESKVNETDNEDITKSTKGDTDIRITETDKNNISESTEVETTMDITLNNSKTGTQAEDQASETVGKEINKKDISESSDVKSNIDTTLKNLESIEPGTTIVHHSTELLDKETAKKDDMFESAKVITDMDTTTINNLKDNNSETKVVENVEKIEGNISEESVDQSDTLEKATRELLELTSDMVEEPVADLMLNNSETTHKNKELDGGEKFSETHTPVITDNKKNTDTEMNNSEAEEYVNISDTSQINCNNLQTENENKRKYNEENEDVNIKKARLEERVCLRPKGVQKVFKGATFWPSDFRQKLCTCNNCLTMYKDLRLLFLLDPEDTVTAYETLGKERIEGAPTTQYEKGLQALSSLDRVQQINALTEYNIMRDKLLDFLKSFKERREIVKEEDIRAFFAGMKPRREPDGVYFCR